jgi:hypothetical protein
VSERLTYPPPTPQADRLLLAGRDGLMEGPGRAIGTEFAGGSEQEISAQIPTGEVRRAIASAAAAYRVAGLGEPEALTIAQRAAASRMELIWRRAQDGVPLSPNWAISSSGGIVAAW